MEPHAKRTRRDSDDSDDSSFSYRVAVNKPDRSKSDYYCEICDSHMNSSDMWESHIGGKRHQRNIKKEPGEPPSKVKAKKVNAPAKILKQLDRIPEPLVGLSFMAEIQRLEPGIDSIYSCYLCQATNTSSTVIEHLLTTKHRLNYIKEVDSEAYYILENLRLKKTNLDSLAADKAQELEEKYGRGQMEVKIEKSKSGSLPILRNKTAPSKDEHRSKRKDEYSKRDSISGPATPLPFSPLTSSMPSSHIPPSQLDNSTNSRLLDNAPVVVKTERPSSPSLPVDFDMVKEFGSFEPNLMMHVMGQFMDPIMRSEADAKAVFQLLNSLTCTIMDYRIRKLPEDIQNRLILELASPETQTIKKALDLKNNALDLSDVQFKEGLDV